MADVAGLSLLDLIQRNVASYRKGQEKAAREQAQAAAEMDALRGQLLAYQSPRLLQRGAQAIAEVQQQAPIAATAGQSQRALSEQYGDLPQMPAGVTPQQELQQMMPLHQRAGESLQALKQAYQQQYGDNVPPEARSVLDLVGQQQQRAAERVQAATLAQVGQQQQRAEQRVGQALPLAQQAVELQRNPALARGYLQGAVEREKAVAAQGAPTDNLARLEGKLLAMEQPDMLKRNPEQLRQNPALLEGYLESLLEQRKRIAGGDVRKQQVEEYKLARDISDAARKYEKLLEPSKAVEQMRALLYDDAGNLRPEISGAAWNAIVIKYVKGLDPTSVARESEVAGAEQAPGLKQYIVTSAQKTATGKIDAKQALQYLQATEKLADVSRRAWEAATAPMRRAAQDLLSPEAQQYVYGLTPLYGQPAAGQSAGQGAVQVAPTSPVYKYLQGGQP